MYIELSCLSGNNYAVEMMYDMPVNLDEIVNLFEGLHPRMMQLTSLVYDYQQIE